jgi:hypothetical protein
VPKAKLWSTVQNEMEKQQHAMESIRVGGKSYHMVCLGIICTIKLTDLTCSASAFTVSTPGTTFPDIFSEMSNC